MAAAYDNTTQQNLTSNFTLDKIDTPYFAYLETIIANFMLYQLFRYSCAP